MALLEAFRRLDERRAARATPASKATADRRAKAAALP
jgi:hypothetical protein